MFSGDGELVFAGTRVFDFKARLLTLNARPNGLRVSSDIRMGCGSTGPILEDYREWEGAIGRHGRAFKSA